MTVLGSEVPSSSSESQVQKGAGSIHSGAPAPPQSTQLPIQPHSGERGLRMFDAGTGDAGVESSHWLKAGEPRGH